MAMTTKELDIESEVDVDGQKHEAKKIRTGGVDVDDAAAERLSGKHVSDDDFLGASKSRNQTLIYRDGREIHVHRLRGKIIALFFAPITINSLPSYLSHFYETLTKKHPFSFDMVFVPLPAPPYSGYGDFDHYDVSFFDKFLSTVPFPAVDFHDLEWRHYLHRVYCTIPSYWCQSVCFIDTRGNKVNVLSKVRTEDLVKYGPECYPFTPERSLQLRHQFYQLGAKESIQDILGSTDSGHYLINRHGDHTLLSDLENKDVALYPYYETHRFDQHEFMKELEVDIYNQTSRDDFEIVFINMRHRCGYEDQTSFDKAIATMPWLALPFNHDKLWNLQYILRERSYTFRDPFVGNKCWGDLPILFIKPKGKARLDPYGYQILKHFGGIASYPFTRRKAASMLMDNLNRMTWKSFVDEAEKLNLDFDNLIQIKSNTETVGVPGLSTFFPNKGRPILLLFAKMPYLSEGRLKSLIDAYCKAKQSSPSSSFEVIFVSLDDSHEEFLNHFMGEPNVMPWYAVGKPLPLKEHSDLLKTTLGFDVNACYSHFIAFGSDGNLLRAGISTSFDSSGFPFLNDDEYFEHVYFCMTNFYKWVGEADNTDPLRQKDGFWDTWVDEYDSDEERKEEQ